MKIDISSFGKPFTDESLTLPPIRLNDDLLFIHLLGDMVVACEVGVNIQQVGGPLTRSLFDLMDIKGDEDF